MTHPHAQELCTCSLRTVLQHGVFECDTLEAKMVSRQIPWPARLLACTSPALHLACCAPSCPQVSVVQVLSQIACGLEYLHGQGIIHGGALRDVV